MRAHIFAGGRAVGMPVMVVAILAVLAGALPALATAQDYGRVDARIDVGYNGYVKRFHWYPVRVTLKNWWDDEREVVVTLTRVQAPSEMEPELVLTQRITMTGAPVGGPPSYTLNFYCPPVGPIGDPSFKLEVRDTNGMTMFRDRRERTVVRDEQEFIEVYWVPYEQAPLGGTARAQTTTDDRERIVLNVSNGNLPVIVQGEGPAGRPAQQFTVLPYLINQLPDNWTGLHGVDVLFLANPDWNALKGDIFNAIRTWVRGGGQLVLALSEKVSEYKTSALDELAGVQLDDIGVYSSPAWVRASDGSVVNIGTDWPLSSQPLAVMKVTPGPRAQVVAAGGDVPLVVRNHVGLGTVTLFTFDVSQPAFTAVPPAEPTSLQEFITESVLHEAARREWFSRTRLAEMSPSRVDYGHEETGTMSLQTRIRRDAGQIQKGEPPSFTTLALFIGLYVLIIGPLDYLLLGLLNMRSWTWLTFSLAVIAFFLFAQIGSEQIKGGKMAVRQITVITGDAAGTVERGEIFSGVFSQANASYELYVNRANARLCRMQKGMGEIGRWSETHVDGSNFNREPSAQQNDPDRGTQLRISQGQNPAHPGLFLEDCFLPRWNIRPIHATYVDSPVQPTPTTSRRLLVTAEGDQLKITNATDFPLDGAIILTRDGVGILRDAQGRGFAKMLPGESRISEARAFDEFTSGAMFSGYVDSISTGESRRYLLLVKWQNAGAQIGSLPPDVQELLLTTLADRARTITDVSYGDGIRRVQIERGGMANLDLSLALEVGATVVFAWTPEMSDGTPPEPLQISNSDVSFEHRTIYRVVCWPEDLGR